MKTHDVTFWGAMTEFLMDYSLNKTTDYKPAT